VKHTRKLKILAINTRTFPDTIKAYNIPDPEIKLKNAQYGIKK
jgi:hypothetical protein